MSNYMLHFALLLHVCSLPQALSLLLRMSQKVGSCRLHWLTVCLNTTALALESKVTTDFNEREREREGGRERESTPPMEPPTSRPCFDSFETSELSSRRPAAPCCSSQRPGVRSSAPHSAHGPARAGPWGGNQGGSYPVPMFCPGPPVEE